MNLLLKSSICLLISNSALENLFTRQSLPTTPSNRQNRTCIMASVGLVGRDESQTPELDRQTKGYIYVTIGPQASGKTTLLSKLLVDDSLQPQTIVDITIDDEVGVYQKVPIQLFYSDPWDPNKNLHRCEALLNTKSFGKYLGHRTFGEENDEMRWIIQRTSGQISSVEFKSKMEILAKKQKETSKRHYLLLSHYGKEELESEKDWVEILFVVVERMIQSVGILSSPTADIFITEAIFKPCMLQGEKIPNAIDRSIQKLYSFANDPSLLNPYACLSWGNTNTKPKDYIAALEAAIQSERPVYFIPFANPDTLPGISDGLYLPHVGLEELFRRNVARLMTTGRYIPSRAIIDSCLRVNLLINDARGHLERSCCRPIESTHENHRWTRMEWNKAFAYLAGYEMFDDGTVKKIPVKARSREDEGVPTVQADSKKIRTGNHIIII